MASSLHYNEFPLEKLPNHHDSDDFMNYSLSNPHPQYAPGSPEERYDRPGSSRSPSDAKAGAAQYRSSSYHYGADDDDRSPVDAVPYVDSHQKQFGYSDLDIDRTPSPFPKDVNDKPDAALVYKAADYGGARPASFQDLHVAEPENRSGLLGDKTPWAQYLSDAKYPLEQRIENKKRGIGRQKHPFVVWILTTIMASVFIYELVVNARAQGSPVSFKPVVNPMLGPSESALINLGARFPPCMKLVEGLPVDTQIACLNDTANPPDQVCSLEDVCGFGGFHNQAPNQWFRFITPVFLHAGFIHIILNMIAQMTASAQIEREMGSGGFFILYMAAGIFGNVLGGNFALVGAPSTGASGAIMGTIAVSFVDLFAHWKYHYRPGRRLAVMLIELLIIVGIGYVPYVDNFAHLGGLLTGFLLGMTFYPIISTTKRHRLIVWSLRLAAIPIVVVLYVVLVRNFYTSDPYAACTWCRYLSCFPSASNNHCQGCVI
ncbi:hypothetical protein JAAARDRAFT_169346 [Jaapia argillacea MUCL 33604]|uniref:Rhomboid-type serine protease n=1 Tax=Jaapia argillacea MUCL 33604 TaxID=933084 RepID=A0A067QLJ4_9AGAM|nr:hypothetical protein JAAARDRAFT_169346 [Jaapia argillacea MUCL 33604]